MVRSLGGKGPLEEGTVTHSSILAWRTSWTEEPGDLQSMLSQSQTRLRLLERAHTHTHNMNLFFLILFPCEFLQNTEHSPLYYTVGRAPLLFIMHSSVHLVIPSP